MVPCEELHESLTMGLHEGQRFSQGPKLTMGFVKDADLGQAVDNY